jgi:hypothetical protein
MKFVESSRFIDPDAAARKLVEVANGIKAVQDGRIYIELVNGAFFNAGGTPDQWTSQKENDRIADFVTDA